MIVRAKTRRGEDWDKVASSLSSPLSFFLILFFSLSFSFVFTNFDKSKKVKRAERGFLVKYHGTKNGY